MIDKLGWGLKDKTQRLLFFTHPSIPSQEGTPQIPLLRGVGVCGKPVWNCFRQIFSKKLNCC